MRRFAVLLTFSFLAACASTSAPLRVSSQSIVNDQGHVVGRKEVLKDPGSGKEREVATYYAPRVDQNGTVIGYEEAVPEGAVIRNLDGRRIGVRYSDLRSRGYNPNKEGISIVVPSAASGKTQPGAPAEPGN
jgi:hypothetical protein